eukprot:1195996-Prorocentrum_minimum.AAC.5
MSLNSLTVVVAEGANRFHVGPCVVADRMPTRYMIRIYWVADSYLFAGLGGFTFAKGSDTMWSLCNVSPIRALSVVPPTIWTSSLQP